MIIAELAKSTAPGLSPVDALYALVADDMAATDRVIHDRMSSAVALIPDLSTHLIDSGGKRLRPMLTLAAATACGYCRQGPYQARRCGGIHPYRDPPP